MIYGTTIAGRLSSVQALMDAGVVETYRDAAYAFGASPEHVESLPDACPWKPSLEEDGEP